MSNNRPDSDLCHALVARDLAGEGAADALFELWGQGHARSHPNFLRPEHGASRRQWIAAAAAAAGKTLDEAVAAKPLPRGWRLALPNETFEDGVTLWADRPDDKQAWIVPVSAEARDQVAAATRRRT